MTFLWPPMLFSLLLAPPAVLLYLRLQQRRQKLAAVFGLRRPPSARAGRHLPPALFLVSLVALLVALARPQAQVRLPRIEGTVILVMDVSASMGAADAQPSRLEAAKAVARAFVQNRPAGVQVGVVSFSGSGFAVQKPTGDVQKLVAAIDRLKPQTGTSLGQGILAALNALAVDAGLELQDAATPDPSQDPSPGRSEDDLLARLPKGPFRAAKIVLLSDGENNQSVDPLVAAQAAAEREVPVDALGFGTPAGTTLELDGFSVHTALDEPALQQIVQAAGGAYYRAQDAGNLPGLTKNLSPQMVIKPEKMEITSLFAGAGILFLLAGAFFSLLWFGRAP